MGSSLRHGHAAVLDDDGVAVADAVDEGAEAVLGFGYTSSFHIARIAIYRPGVNGRLIRGGRRHWHGRLGHASPSCRMGADTVPRGMPREPEGRSAFHCGNCHGGAVAGGLCDARASGGRRRRGSCAIAARHPAGPGVFGAGARRSGGAARAVGEPGLPADPGEGGGRAPGEGQAGKGDGHPDPLAAREGLSGRGSSQSFHRSGRVCSAVRTSLVSLPLQAPLHPPARCRTVQFRATSTIAEIAHPANSLADLEIRAAVSVFRRVPVSVRLSGHLPDSHSRADNFVISGTDFAT